MPGASVRDVGGKHASFCARSQIARPRTRAHECIGDGALVPAPRTLASPSPCKVGWSDGGQQVPTSWGSSLEHQASVRSTELSFVAWQAGELAFSGGHRRWAFVDSVDDLGVVDAAEIHRGNGKVCVLDMRVIWQLGQGSRHRLSSVADWPRGWIRGGRVAEVARRAAGAERLPRARRPAGGRWFRSVRCPEGGAVR